MIKFRNLFNKNLCYGRLRPKMPDIWGLLYLFSLSPNVNAVFNVLAIKHWLLYCVGQLKNSYPFWLNVQAY